MCWITDPANALAANTNCMFKRRAIEDGPLVGVDEVERLIKPSSVKTQEQLDVEESVSYWVVS